MDGNIDIIMEDFNSKYTGEQVEGYLDQIANGEIGGGIEAETDPIFSASPAASITEDDIRTWNSDHTVVEDLNIDVAQLVNDVKDKQDAIADLETIRDGASKGATALQSIPEEYVTEDNLIWTKVEGEAGVRLKGTNGTATGNLAISAGDDKTASDGTPFASVASGDHAVAFGYGNTCSGRTTLAQGLYNIVTAKDSVAFGQRNTVNGDQAFAAGQQNEVSARIGVAIGYKNKATNTDSIAIGYQNTSSGSASVAMGDTCEASGTSSVAMGYKTKATGASSSTFGQNTQATNEGEVAMGLYNKSTTSTDAAEQTMFSFGIGTSDTNRANALEIKKNGDVYIGDRLLSSEGDGSEDTYITPFTVEDVANLYNGNIATLSIPTALIEAVIAKKRVLIPSEYDFGNGFAELTYAEGYIGGGDAGLSAYFFMMTYLYHIYLDEAISGDAIIANKEHVSLIQVADENSIVGISSIKQTTTSNADGGSNIVTATLTDGTTSTFTVKNGSKGSQGIQGEQGPKGDKGDKGDTGAAGANGTNGVSVSSVKQTTTSSADGGTNVVTVTLSNGTTSTFSVKNGSKGSNGTNGTNGKDGADGATFTPSVDSAGNLSWSNNKGLTNPPTVNIKGPKGDKGDSGSGGGGSSEKEVVEVEATTKLGSTRVSFADILPNKIYICNEPIDQAVTITFASSTSPIDDYTVIFRSLYAGTLLNVPDNVIFKSDVVIGRGMYEFSFRRINWGDEEVIYGLHAEF